MISVRRAMRLDCKSMAQLLNSMVEEDGNTSLTRAVTARDIADWMADDADRSAWYVAIDAEEQVVGVQWICPRPKLPAEAVDVATFVKIGRTGLGIGSALFEATAQAAKALGYSWINATIRADNAGGLTYYQSRGFRTWAHNEAVVPETGQIVEKISKRFDL